MDFAKVIWSDPVNKWLFSNIKEDIFLVGGYIRDLHRGGYINKDKDYVIKDNIRDVALRASNKFKGTFIELKKNLTCRVALKNGNIIDFSQMRNTILEDLGKRDFRINAIAWSPQLGVIDPFSGKADLKNKIIRIINPQNLKEDPLRILRAYRLAAQLGFTIDNKTRDYLRNYSSLIKETASERITEELFKLLVSDNASYYISLCEKDNVLDKILYGTQANIRLNINSIYKFDQFISSLQYGKLKKLFNSGISPVLNLNIGQGLNRSGLIRLSILLNNLRGAKENNFGNIKYSKYIVKRVRNIQDGIKISTGRITRSKLYNILKVADDCAFEAALLLSVTKQKNVDKFLKKADDFIRFKKYPLLDGYKIQHILNIEPSSLIGKIQAEIHRRRFLGITRTKIAAADWAISYFT